MTTVKTRRGKLFRIGVLWAASALGLLAGASPTGAVTIGQVAVPYLGSCTPGYDWVQPTVTSGTSYVVPAGGTTITSWSTMASATAGSDMSLKVFRKVAEPATYMAVAHDGPRNLTPGALNTFAVNIPVKPGDVLGLNPGTSGQTGCYFSVPGEAAFVRAGNLADGESGTFMANPNARLDISAEVTIVTGDRAAALKICKKKHKKNHNKKKFKKCTKKANLLPL